MKKHLRLILSLIATLIAAFVIVRYLLDHRSLLKQLSHISPFTILILLGLYVIIFGILLAILHAILRICDKKINSQENVLLNAYSLFINFFIPGQGGPAFRGYYLKKRHGLKVRNYVLASLLYYGLYGILSIFFIFIGSRPWWQSLLAATAMIIIAVVVGNIVLGSNKLNKGKLSPSLRNVGWLLLATFGQIVLQAVVYFVELHSANKHIGLHQIITYTGVANLALFVALTPGAIGIRESFLVLSERLHHISSANIVVANVIDRSVYLVFLAIILILIISLHARDKLLVKQKPETIS